MKQKKFRCVSSLETNGQEVRSVSYLSFYYCYIISLWDDFINISSSAEAYKINPNKKVTCYESFLI